MSFGSKKFLSIDWDKKHLRMGVVRMRGDDVELLKAVTVPIPPEVRGDDAESFGAFVREAMRQSRIAVKKAIVCISREQVVLNTLNLPPTPAEEMPSIIHFQIAKELPFAADQATIDFVVCGEHDPKLSCLVLVAAVRNEDLQFFHRVAREAGLSIERAGLRPFANLLAVLASEPDLKSRSLLVVELGPMLTEIDIIQSGALTFSRAASVVMPDRRLPDAETIRDSRITASPIQDIRPDETTAKPVELLMVEVTRSFEAHRATDPSVKVEHVVVCGATGLEVQLAETLAARFAARATLFSPARVFDLSPQRAKELRGFSAVLGLVKGMQFEGLEAFDFDHPKKPISKRRLRLKKAPTAILTGAILIAAAVAAQVKFIRPELARVERLEAAVRNAKKREKPITTFAKQVEALGDWKRSEQYWPQVLARLTRNFPPDEEGYVTRISFNTRPKRRSTERVSTMKLKLRTADLGRVNMLSEKLLAAGFISVVPGRETGGRVSRPGEIYHHDTTIEARIPLRPEPKAGPAFEDEGSVEAPEGEAGDEPAAEASPITAGEGGGQSPAPLEEDRGVSPVAERSPDLGDQSDAPGEKGEPGR